MAVSKTRSSGRRSPPQHEVSTPAHEGLPPGGGPNNTNSSFSSTSSSESNTGGSLVLSEEMGWAGKKRGAASVRRRDVTGEPQHEDDNNNPVDDEDLDNDDHSGSNEGDEDGDSGSTHGHLHPPPHPNYPTQSFAHGMIDRGGAPDDSWKLLSTPAYFPPPAFNATEAVRGHIMRDSVDSVFQPIGACGTRLGEDLDDEDDEDDDDEDDEEEEEDEQAYESRHRSLRTELEREVRQRIEAAARARDLPRLESMCRELKGRPGLGCIRKALKKHVRRLTEDEGAKDARHGEEDYGRALQQHLHEQQQRQQAMAAAAATATGTSPVVMSRLLFERPNLLSACDASMRQHTTVVDLMPGVVGWVIGKGGQRIKEIMAQSQCKMWVDQDMPPDEPRKLHFMGTKAQVEAALHMVNDLLRTAPILQTASQQRGLGDHGLFSQVSAMAALEEAKAAAAAAVMSGLGPQLASPMKAAKPAPQTVLDCPPHLVGLLIGKKGWTIKKIQQETGAQVSINQAVKDGAPRKIYISGTRSSVEKASRMIREVLAYPGPAAQALLRSSMGQSSTPLSVALSSLGPSTTSGAAGKRAKKAKQAAAAAAAAAADGGLSEGLTPLLDTLASLSLRTAVPGDNSSEGLLSSSSSTCSSPALPSPTAKSQMYPLIGSPTKRSVLEAAMAGEFGGADEYGAPTPLVPMGHAAFHGHHNHRPTVVLGGAPNAFLHSPAISTGGAGGLSFEPKLHSAPATPHGYYSRSPLLHSIGSPPSLPNTRPPSLDLLPAFNSAPGIISVPPAMSPPRSTHHTNPTPINTNTISANTTTGGPPTHLRIDLPSTPPPAMAPPPGLENQPSTAPARLSNSYNLFSTAPFSPWSATPPDSAHGTPFASDPGFSGSGGAFFAPGAGTPTQAHAMSAGMGMGGMGNGGGRGGRMTEVSAFLERMGLADYAPFIEALGIGLETLKFMAQPELEALGLPKFAAAKMMEGLVSLKAGGAGTTGGGDRYLMNLGYPGSHVSLEPPHNLNKGPHMYGGGPSGHMSGHINANDGRGNPQSLQQQQQQHMGTMPPSGMYGAPHGMHPAYDSNTHGGNAMGGMGGMNMGGDGVGMNAQSRGPTLFSPHFVSRF